MAYISLISSFVIWGLSPIYWKLLTSIDNLELGSYRIIISAIVLLFFLKPSQFGKLIKDFSQYKKLIFISSSCMFTNIFLFIYAVNSGQILQASFGYFLSPLISITLGGIVLKEKLSKVKVFAIFMTVISLAIRFSDFHSFPWIAVGLAGAFSLYGLLKKFIHIETKQMTLIEMSILVIPSLLILLYLSSAKPQGLMDQVSHHDKLILLLAWAPTLLPFLFFNYGAKKIPLNIVGFFQYLAPSLQFLVGYFIYNELILATQWVSFLLIWCACAMVAISNYKRGISAR